MEIDLYFAPNLNKLTGKSPQTVKAYKADQILFTNLNKKYQIQNDSSDEYNRQMETLNEEILSIESKVKLVTKQMVQEYKKYTNQDCIFFEDMYYEIIAEAFDTKTKKQLELDKLGASLENVKGSRQGKFFIIATIGYGKANAAMAITYLMEEYPALETILNVDLALSTNDKFDTTDMVLATKFIYRDADLTVFKDIKYGQIIHEPEAFIFDTDFVQNVKNFKLGASDGIIGTADMLIYNSKQFKEMVDKYGQSIDVIDTEAGSLAQIAKKSSVNFVAFKVMYNNALSP
ncbi:hypothetical protein FQR65_LT17173 [Abscondita terminalis]|nr:hypothetical protein FQR65_LT17173 [Abscondita terminalis]